MPKAEKCYDWAKYFTTYSSIIFKELILLSIYFLSHTFRRLSRKLCLGVRHGREVSTPDCCKAVPGSNSDPAPPKLKIHAAIDGHPICRILPKFVDDQSHGSESTKKKKKKKKKIVKHF
jgi:hypothetical protein